MNDVIFMTPLHGFYQLKDVVSVNKENKDKQNLNTKKRNENIQKGHSPAAGHLTKEIG